MIKHGLADQVTEPREWVSPVVCRCGHICTAYGRTMWAAHDAASRGMLAHLASHPEPVRTMN